MSMTNADPFRSDIRAETTYPMPIEIAGAEEGVITPWDAFESEPVRVGDYATDGEIEIGEDDGDDEVGGDIEIGDYATEGDIEIGDYASDGGDIEIGAEEAVARTVMKARDNRQPAPKMRAVDVDAPLRDTAGEWAVADVCIGAALTTPGPEPFPILTRLLQRAGAGMPPRFVRVDTEKSYQQFRTQNSPEMAELAQRVDGLARTIAAHMDDPHAHGRLAEDVEDLTLLGAEVQAAEEAKVVDLRLPAHFHGRVRAWHEGGYSCASLVLPKADGGVWICTSLEPIQKGVAEMARAASDAGVPARAIVPVLPAMGTTLGAATVVKQVAAAAPALLRRPEAQGDAPFVVRIEPKAAPALCALCALLWLCHKGDPGACKEWDDLAAQATGSIRQAMGEAKQVLKAMK